MGGLELLLAGKIGNGASHLEHAMAAAGREAEPLHGGTQQLRQLGGLLAMAPEVARRQVCIRWWPSRRAEALTLPNPRCFHPGADSGAWLGRTIAREIAERQGRDLQVHIDPIEQRSREPHPIVL